MRLPLSCALVLLMIPPLGASADEGSDSCPFPLSPASPETSPDTDDAVGDFVEAVVEVFLDNDHSHDASSYHYGPPEPFRWPKGMTARLEGGYSQLDLTDADFELAGVSLTGSALALGEVDLAGSELALEFQHDLAAFGIGLGVYSPVGGEEGGVLATRRFGRAAVSDHVVVSNLFVEGGINKSLGAVELFALAHARYVHASVQVRTACGTCTGTFGASRTALGPRVGARLYVFEDVFLQGAVLMDVLHAPDAFATLGIGIGR